MAYKQISPQSVAEGGTGASSLTDHGVLVGSGTGAISVTAVGTATHVLTSNGAGLDPTFQASGGSGDVTGPVSSTDNALARWDGTGGDTLQDSTVIVTDNGEMTNSSQPAFLAYLGTTDSNVTGNGTTYTLGGGNALTEVFDQNSDFTTAGVFTAPVTGRYFLNTNLRYGDCTGTMTYVVLNIGTSNRSYGFCETSPVAYVTVAAASNLLGIKGSTLADMDAADTATVTSAIHGGAGNTADVLTNSAFTSFSGALIC